MELKLVFQIYLLSLQRVLIVPFMELKHQLTLVNRLWNLS